MSDIPAVELRDVTFSYDGAPVLEDVTFTVPELDFVGIVGPNGGGKTTLLKLMLGLLEPDAGSVRVFGGSPEEMARRVGYVPQNFQYPRGFPITVRDVVLMGRLGRDSGLGPFVGRDVTELSEVLATVGLEGMERHVFAEMSGGQQQRALIARALLVEPDMLILDEPTADLDVAAEREIWRLLQELNATTTVILVTHDLGFVSDVVKSVLCVNRQVRRHPTTEISEITGELLEGMYGSDLRVVRHDQTSDGGDCFE
ncbi:MAG: ABC transporter ATP-binding protein [Armatimonadota bacterium]|nr:ABC transporter ATP-binding protein [Armatimonadota bacterium]